MIFRMFPSPQGGESDLVSLDGAGGVNCPEHEQWRRAGQLDLEHRRSARDESSMIPRLRSWHMKCYVRRRPTSTSELSMKTLIATFCLALVAACGGQMDL